MPRVNVDGVRIEVSLSAATALSSSGNGLKSRRQQLEAAE
jgi:hypothetical protein